MQTSLCKTASTYTARYRPYPSPSSRRCSPASRRQQYLAGSEKVETMHIAEAIGYRNLVRGDWAERGI